MPWRGRCPTAAAATREERFAAYPRDETAAVNAIASGLQHSTISAISHLIARSSSWPAPTSSATYLIGAASVSI